MFPTIYNVPICYNPMESRWYSTVFPHTATHTGYSMASQVRNPDPDPKLNTDRNPNATLSGM